MAFAGTATAAEPGGGFPASGPTRGFLTRPAEGPHMYERLLVATDGSEASEAAVGVATTVASATDAAATVVVASGGELDDETAEAVAAEAADRFPDGAATRVADRPPRDAIVAAAAETDADLVVVGRTGRRGLGERLLGSVTEGVLRSSDRPVLSVPAGADPDAIGDVLVTTDGSEPALSAAPHAAGLAAAGAGSLHLLAVVDVVRAGGAFSAGGVDEAFVDRLVDDAEADIDELAAACSSTAPDVSVRRAVRQGTPSEEIVAEAEEAAVGLVAMGSVGAGSLGGQLLGSTADRVLRMASVPVLVVHPED